MSAGSWLSKSTQLALVSIVPVMMCLFMAGVLQCLTSAK